MIAKSLLLKAMERSEHRQYRHVTLVLRGGAVLAHGYNRGHKHSEVNALSHLWPNKRRGVSILNVMFRKNGEMGKARPCDGCMEYLRSQGVVKVTYYDGKGAWISERV